MLTIPVDRTFQTEVLQHLIKWAAGAIDKSINQPTLPHIVIVINATDASIDDSQWETENATDGLLNEYRDSVRQVHYLQKKVAQLTGQGKKIETTKDLLEYYYSSVTVMRIPSKGRYMQIDEQVGKLYQIISSKCVDSHSHKKKIRMLLNSERLPQYVKAAYDHFCQHIDKPFDFMKVARQHAPPPQDFGGHILNLILSIYSMHDTPTSDGRALFQKLTLPIASCLRLTATREDIQGNTENHFTLSCG